MHCEPTWKQMPSLWATLRAWRRRSAAAAGAALVPMSDSTPGVNVRKPMLQYTDEEAQKALEAGRVPMEKANLPDDVRKVLQQASLAARVGADPEKDSCGASAILRTKRYRLEAFGRQEAVESKKRKIDVRMPEEFIKKVMDMPNMEVEVQLCGEDEYFAEGVVIELQQGSKRIKPIDIGKADRGRKNEGKGPAFRSRFTALFAYEQFDPNAKTVLVVNLQDGQEARIPADFSKVK